MKICVFGAASSLIDGKYIEETEKLGEEMARRGHSLVFGAGGTGVMGAVARGVKRGGGTLHGVVPTFFHESGIERLYLDCDKVTYTETMRERKGIMEDDAEAFVIAPGGVGTFEEFYEVLTLKQLGRHNKAIAVFNISGYYDNLQAFMEETVRRRFVTKDCVGMYACFTDIGAMLDYIEGYRPPEISLDMLKY